MYKLFTPKQLGLSIALVAASNSGAALAQEESYTLEEVVVTAQKRSENIQDVPISISALSGAKIVESGIKDMDDLSAFVPNLDISTGNNTQIRMRGLGSGLNKGFEQSVGMYIDGIYHGRDRSYRGSLLDLERVEVLRGPQGILFGKNTIAGAINIVTAKPSQDFSAEIGATIGSDNQRKIHGIVSGGLSENISARLAVMGESQDGYIDNSLPTFDGVDTEDKAIRASFLWDVSDDLVATLKLEHGEFERFGTTYQVTDSGIYTDAYFSQFAPNFESNFDDNTHIDNTLGAQQESTKNNNVTLNLDYQLGELSLVSTTGFISFKSNDFLDVDFSPVPLLYQNVRQDYEQFSQEIRLASAGGETVDYIVGVYYQNSDFIFENDTSYNLIPAGINATARTVKDFDQSSETVAVFAETTWNVDDNFSLTAGLRYSRETKDVVTKQELFQLDGTAGTGFTSAVLGGFGIVAHQQTGDRSESNVTPLIKASYALSDDIMLYATASTGFKGGGFNTEVLNPATSTLEFDNESSKAVEIGMKSTLLDGAAQFNLSLFRTDFEDLQVSGFDGLAFIVGNAAEATSQGVEMDGMWRVSENLTFGSSYAFLDSTYGKYVNAPCTYLQKASTAGACQQDISGETLPYAAENTANLNVSYELPMGDDYSLEFAADANYSDEFLLQADLDPLDEQEAFTKINARVVLRNLANEWEVSLIGKNLTDKRTTNNGVDIPLLEGGSHVKNTLAPRTVSLQLISRF